MVDGNHIQTSQGPQVSYCSFRAPVMVVNNRAISWTVGVYLHRPCHGGWQPQSGLRRSSGTFLLVYLTCKDCQLPCSFVDGLCVPSPDTVQYWAVHPNRPGPQCGRSQPCMSQAWSSSTVQTFSPTHDGSLRPSKKIHWWVRTVGLWWWLITTVPWQGGLLPK